MSGTFGIFRNELSNININYLLNSINPLNLCNTHLLDIDGIGLIGVSFLKNSPLKGERYYRDNSWIVVFTGDIIDYKMVPYKEIITILKDGIYDSFKKFNGIFSIAAYNKQSNKLLIVSNRLSSYPIYYLINEESIYFSTDMSTFCRLQKKLKFNKKWLWEYLFFNFPIGQTTFLENVKRMPPACVLEINVKSWEYYLSNYANKFCKKKNLLEGKEALEHAYDVFKERVPKYFLGSNNIACALTGGWDGRTNLSFCQDLNSLTLYTYGVPGCKDLVQSSEIAKVLNIGHRKILFDEKFKEKLPSMIFNTIYLSSGLEQLVRSTLLHVYKNLTDFGKKYPIVISGISLDLQFRGHGNIPSLISPDMSRIFSTGEKVIDEDFWKNCMGDEYEPFKNHILKQIDNLEKDYGKFISSETYLSFIIYELAPKYFDGEHAIAKYFTTLRIPSWDNHIVDLAYSIVNSTLSFSQFLSDHKRGSMEETILQSYMISKNGGPLQEIPVDGVPPKIIIKDKSLFHFTRIKNLYPKEICNLILGNRFPPLEDWDKWLSVDLKETISLLIFSENSLIKNYINPEYINSLKNKLSDRFTAKFATIEIILKLLRNDWMEKAVL